MNTLQPVSEDNFLDVFRQELTPGQEDRCVGYVMVIYDYDIPKYDIWHMYVDKAHQGMHFESSNLVKEYGIRTKHVNVKEIIK